MLAAAFVLVHSFLPMRGMMALGFSESVICGAHGIETILLDQDMNRVSPDAAKKQSEGHCGHCTLVLGLLIAIALIISLAYLALLLPLHSGDQWRPQRLAFRLAFSRAPPPFA